jgi:hypothetical protein
LNKAGGAALKTWFTMPIKLSFESKAALKRNCESFDRDTNNLHLLFLFPPSTLIFGTLALVCVSSAVLVCSYWCNYRDDWTREALAIRWDTIKAIFVWNSNRIDAPRFGNVDAQGIEVVAHPMLDSKDRLLSCCWAELERERFHSQKRQSHHKDSTRAFTIAHFKSEITSATPGIHR